MNFFEVQGGIGLMLVGFVLFAQFVLPEDKKPKGWSGWHILLFIGIAMMVISWLADQSVDYSVSYPLAQTCVAEKLGLPESVITFSQGACTAQNRGGYCTEYQLDWETSTARGSAVYVSGGRCFGITVDPTQVPR